jgi:peptidoglycan/xylan/chitin deacetylase (PgdA/CDA1 family)
VRTVIELSRRRILLGAVCLALVALPVAGWSTGRGSDTSRAADAGPVSDVRPGPDAGRSSSADPAVPRPSGAASPSSGAASPSSGAAPSAGTPAGSGPALPPPVGWSPADVPRFPPAPTPEPITRPDSDQVPFLSRIPVTQPVAFLTIDDGYLKSPEAPKLLAAAHIPVTLFLTVDAIRDDVAYFDRLRDYGAVIEAHTITHPELRGRSHDFQHHEICDGADRLGQWYGRRPVLFRPPFGDKDGTTLRVAGECGLRAAFMWKETVDKGKVRYQEGHRVQPGDIILMHFRPAFVKDFLAALRAIHQAGLTPALLENYIP